MPGRRGPLPVPVPSFQPDDVTRAMATKIANASRCEAGMEKCSSQPSHPTLQGEQAQRGPNQGGSPPDRSDCQTARPRTKMPTRNSHVFMNYPIEYAARLRLAASCLTGDVSANRDQDQRTDRHQNGVTMKLRIHDVDGAIDADPSVLDPSYSRLPGTGYDAKATGEKREHRCSGDGLRREWPGFGTCRASGEGTCL